jgi:anti-sigma-K factor RskA
VSTTEHRRWEDDLAAWMLGALDEPEAERFERHLAGCERCRTDLDRLRPAVDSLPASVTPVAPPPRLRGRLLGIVRAEARREAAPQRRRWLPRLAIPRPAIAALAAAALVLAGVVGYVVRGDGTDTLTTQFQASQEAREAKAELVVEDGSGTLEARDLPRLKRDEAFQAWIQDEGSTELAPSIVFRPSRGGAATESIGGLEDADLVMVSREPRGGSAQPTTAPLLRAKLD